MADFRSNRNVLFSCKYHVVFCPKYRKPVLNPPIDAKLKKLIQQVCDETQSELIEMEFMPDHVHLLIGCDPQYGIHRLVKGIKGRSSRVLRQQFRVLRTRIPTLWTNSYILKSAEFSVLFCIFSLPDMITRTAVGEPQVRRKPVISRNGRLTGRFSLPFLRSLPVSAFLSNPLLTRVPSGACRSLSYAAPSLIFSRTPRKWVPSRNSYSPCKTRIIWGFPPRVRQGKRHSRVTEKSSTINGQDDRRSNSSRSALEYSLQGLKF